MLIRAALAAALVALAVVLALVLLDSKPRQAGTNYVPEYAEALTIEGNGSHCQGGEVIPADAASLRLLLGTYGRPTPKVAVSVRQAGRAITSGTLAAGGAEGHSEVPIASVDELRTNAEVCLRVSGVENSQRTVLYGIAGKVRLEWLRQPDESWVEFLPTVAHRFGLGKAFFTGAWALALAALVLAATWLLALRLAVRELSR